MRWTTSRSSSSPPTCARASHRTSPRGATSRPRWRGLARRRIEPSHRRPGQAHNFRSAPQAGGGRKEAATMALYLTRFSYTPETWARLMKKPEDRRDAARKYIEAVEGKLHGFWYAFGEYDGYTLWEAPDNVSMAAVALAIGAGGALSKIETTPLLTVDDTLQALKRAQGVAYRPPGA